MIEKNIYVWTRSPSRRAKIPPSEFLSWAKLDIKAGDRRGIANALTNTKRALHARMDEILYSVRVRYASDWSAKPDTEPKLKVLKRLNISTTTIVKVLTESRNDLEHGYLLPGLDQVRAAVETAELWLEKSESYLRPTIGIGGLPTTSFGVSGEPNKVTVFGDFTTPRQIVFFWDTKRKIIQLKPDGSTVETDYRTLGWKELIKFQQPFLSANRGFTVVPLLAVTKIFRAYERWVVEGKQCSFRLNFPA